ncbi:hypothetical protein WJX73_008911 [Symbiochloris irregularis]|uniref:Protein kinase domain-containing protein n=1 Tax=Symbiochloris irregularis TaxID=706552 RepID=A0AAW1NMJ1_9CHLO
MTRAELAWAAVTALALLAQAQGLSDVSPVPAGAAPFNTFSRVLAQTPSPPPPSPASGNYSDDWWNAQFNALRAAPGVNATLLTACSANESAPLPSVNCTGNLANYSSGVSVNYSTGCITENGANYNGTLVPSPLNLQITQTAAECCNLCAQVNSETLPFPCNSWVWCGNPTGCCGLQGGCVQSSTNSAGIASMLPFGVCTLKYMYQVKQDQAYQSQTPVYWYRPADVLAWPGWNGGAASQQCKSFTSGVYISYWQTSVNPLPTTPSGFNMYPAEDIPGSDYGCAGSQDPTPTQYCRQYGNLTAVAEGCTNDPECQAFSYQDQGCCGQTQPVGFRKRLPFPEAIQECPVLLPYSKLYVQPSRLQASAQSASSSSNTGAIVGGVVGGIVGGLALLAAVAVGIAMTLKRRRGSWPAWFPIKRDPALATAMSRRHLPVSDGSPRPSGGSVQVPLTADLNHSGASSAPSTFQGRMSAPDSGVSATFNTRPSAKSGSLSTLPTFDAPSSPEPTDGANAGTKVLNNMKALRRSSTKEEWEINPDDIQIAKKEDGRDHFLGGGGFGVVFKGWRNGVDPVAVKVLKGEQDARLTDAFIKEIDILRRARHPHVVQYLGAVVQGNRMLLVCEYCEGGDLWTALSQHDSQFQWYKRGRNVACDVAQALNYLHSYNTIHFDLKSANILLSRDGTAKVADVGLARIMKSSHYTKVGMQATWSWAAPEVILGQKCTVKADVYSFGICIWEIVTQEIPVRGQLRPIEVPKECPEDVRDLYWSCTDPDPDKRPDMRGIIEALKKHQ